MSDIFKDIYNNKLNLDYGKLFKNFAENSYQKAKLEEVQEQVESTTLPEIEQILRKSRENPEIPLTDIDSKKALFFIDALKQDSPLIRKEIFDFKAAMHDDILSQNDKYSLDISKNESLKRAAIEVFNTSKTKITYEDYIVLLELKKQIEINEQINLLLEEENDIFE